MYEVQTQGREKLAAEPTIEAAQQQRRVLALEMYDAECLENPDIVPFEDWDDGLLIVDTASHAPPAMDAPPAKPPAPPSTGHRYHVICFVDAKGNAYPKPGRVVLSTSEELAAIQGKLRIGARGFLFDAELDNTWDVDLADWLDAATEVVDRFHACLGEDHAAGDVDPVPAAEPPWSSSRSGGLLVVNKAAVRRYLLATAKRKDPEAPVPLISSEIYADVDDLVKTRLAIIVNEHPRNSMVLKPR